MPQVRALSCLGLATHGNSSLNTFKSLYLIDPIKFKCVVRDTDYFVVITSQLCCGWIVDSNSSYKSRPSRSFNVFLLLLKSIFICYPTYHAFRLRNWILEAFFLACFKFCFKDGSKLGVLFVEGTSNCPVLALKATRTHFPATVLIIRNCNSTINF